MNPRSRKILVFVLIGIFALWILSSVPSIFSPKSTHPSSKPNKEGTSTSQYEPKFRKDGELWILRAESQDTLAHLDIELAQTDEAIQYGMMYRKSMDFDRGMLFKMQYERPQSFWMKNTYISLDIIYINSQMNIVSIQEKAEPLSEKSLPSYEPAIYVLEVNGGYSEAMGVKPGDKVVFKTNAELQGI